MSADGTRRALAQSYINTFGWTVQIHICKVYRSISLVWFIWWTALALRLIKLQLSEVNILKVCPTERISEAFHFHVNIELKYI